MMFSCQFTPWTTCICCFLGSGCVLHVYSGGSRGGSVGSMEPPFGELPSFNSQCA